MAKDSMVNLCASATAGCVSRLICHPIDTCKAKLQSLDTYRDTADVVKQTLRREGLVGFYRGIGAALIGGIPGVCLYITTYESSKAYIAKNQYLQNQHMLTYFTSGMVAEAVCCSVFVPVDVIKERLQVQTSVASSSQQQYKGGLDALSTILRQEGLRGLYKGYGATLFSYGPFSALYFLLFEESKKLASSLRTDATLVNLQQPEFPLSFQDNLLCSAVAGSVASYVTNPLDIAKLRYQIQRNAVAIKIAKNLATTPSVPVFNTAQNEVLYSGLFDALAKIYRSRGLSGLFRGAWTRVLFHTPATAITMAVYEECKGRWAQLLGKQ